MMSACKVRKKDHGAQAEQSVFLQVWYALVPGKMPGTAGLASIFTFAACHMPV